MTEPEVVQETQTEAAPAGPPPRETDFGDDFSQAFAALDPELAGEDEGGGEEGEPEAEGADVEAPGTALEVAAKKDAPATEDDEELERALLSLRYAHGKAADKVIKNASREELIAWGTEAADRRAKTEAALEERAQRIRELEEGTKAPVEGAATADAPKTDWTPHLKALAKTFGLEPEVASEAFGPVLDAVASQVRAEFNGRLSTHEQTLKESQAAEGRRQISAQVQRLSATYPKLKTDQDLVQRLTTKAFAMAKAARDQGTPYESAEALFDDVASLKSMNLGVTAAIAAKRRNGSAPPPEGRVEDRSENSDDAFMNTLDRVEAGDMRGARRAGVKVFQGLGNRRTRE